MITNTTIGLLSDDLYPPATSRTYGSSGECFLTLLPSLCLSGDREKLADLLRGGLTALYSGHPPVDAEAIRWAFGPMGMVRVGGDDDE